MKQILTPIITFVFTFIITACIPTGWFPDWCIEPQIEENETYHNLTIPSEGATYEIPFVSIHIKNHQTKTSVKPNYHQIRSRMIIDDSISEVFDAYLNDVVGYHFDSVEEKASTLVVNIPHNECKKQVFDQQFSEKLDSADFGKLVLHIVIDKAVMRQRAAASLLGA